MKKNSNKNTVKLLCPVCGREHYINNQYKVKCICGSSLLVVKDGKTKTLVREEDRPKPETVRCRDCVNYSPTGKGIGDCTNLDKMKRNVSGDCLTVCKRFMKKKEEAI